MQRACSAQIAHRRETAPARKPAHDDSPRRASVAQHRQPPVISSGHRAFFTSLGNCSRSLLSPGHGSAGDPPAVSVNSARVPVARRLPQPPAWSRKSASNRFCRPCGHSSRRTAVTLSSRMSLATAPASASRGGAPAVPSAHMTPYLGVESALREEMAAPATAPYQSTAGAGPRGGPTRRTCLTLQRGNAEVTMSNTIAEWLLLLGLFAPPLAVIGGALLLALPDRRERAAPVRTHAAPVAH